MANDPETPSPDVMEVWREANEAASTEIVLCEAPECRACLAAANVLAEAKARWEREALERATQVAERLAFPTGVYLFNPVSRLVCLAHPKSATRFHQSRDILASKTGRKRGCTLAPTLTTNAMERANG